MQVSTEHDWTGSRGKVVAAAVDELIDVNVVNDIVWIVVGRQVGEHQIILVKVVHHCASHHNNYREAIVAKPTAICKPNADDIHSMNIQCNYCSITFIMQQHLTVIF